MRVGLVGVGNHGFSLVQEFAFYREAACFADTRKAEKELGFVARQDFAQSLAALAEWVSGQQAHDRIAEARSELEKRGLVA